MTDKQPRLGASAQQESYPVDGSLDAAEYQEISDEIKRIGDQLDEMIARANRFLES